MGRYTVYDKAVDEAVEKDLFCAVEMIRSVDTVRSIILGGGFGRGEGSVLVEGGVVRPVNDYDFFVVVSDEDRTDFRRMGKEAAAKLNIRLMDIIPIKYSELPKLPQDQFNYDLKYGGVCLWGEDCLKKMPEFRQGHVEPGAARTLVLNRLICAIEAYSERFEGGAMTPEEVFFLVNQTGKVVSACVEALLIIENRYDHSYRRRQEIFDAMPGRERLKRLNRTATDFKLRPTLCFTGDGAAYWNEAIQEFAEVAAAVLVPGSSGEKDLWKELRKKSTPIVNTPVERIELLLLLSHVTDSFFTKRFMLAKARKALEDVSGEKMKGADWEELREKTALLWHKLYH